MPQNDPNRLNLPQKKRTRQEFASAVRIAYPAVYDDIDDDSLVDAMMKAYPGEYDNVESREESTIREVSSLMMPSHGPEVQGKELLMPSHEKERQHEPFELYQSIAEGVTGGFYRPNYVNEEGSAVRTIGNLLGGAAPVLGTAIATGGAGLPMAVAGGLQGMYAGAARSKDALQAGEPMGLGETTAHVAGQGVLGAALARIPGALGKSVPAKVATGLALGPAAATAPLALDQIISQGKLDPSDPAYADPYAFAAKIGLGMGVGAGVGASIPARQAGPRPAYANPRRMNEPSMYGHETNAPKQPNPQPDFDPQRPINEVTNDPGGGWNEVVGNAEIGGRTVIKWRLTKSATEGVPPRFDVIFLDDPSGVVTFHEPVDVFNKGTGQTYKVDPTKTKGVRVDAPEGTEAPSAYAAEEATTQPPQQLALPPATAPHAGPTTLRKRGFAGGTAYDIIDENGMIVDSITSGSNKGTWQVGDVVEPTPQAAYKSWRKTATEAAQGAAGSAVAFSLAEDNPETSEDERLMAAALPIPGFYSKLRKNVGEFYRKVGAKAIKPQTLLANLRHFSSAEEVKWTGVDDFLKEKMKLGQAISADEIDSYLHREDVRVEEVRLGEGQDYNQARTEIYAAFDRAYPTGYDTGALTDVVNATLMGKMFDPKSKAFGKLAVSVGGRDLGDGSWALPEAASAALKPLSRVLQQAPVYGPQGGPQNYNRWRTGNDNYREIILTLPSHKGLYNSHNWRPENIEGEAPLAHIRTSDRKVGKSRYLVVEEIQSDLQQELTRRERGQNRGASPNELAAQLGSPRQDVMPENQILPLGEARKSKNRVYTIKRVPKDLDGNSNRITLEEDGVEVSSVGAGWSNKSTQDLVALLGDRDELTVTPDTIKTVGAVFSWVKNPHNAWNPNFDNNPDLPAVEAPFTPAGMDWQSLSVKRALRLASEEDYDGVFFVGGEEHAARHIGPGTEPPVGAQEFSGLPVHWEYISGRNEIRLTPLGDAEDIITPVTLTVQDFEAGGYASLLLTQEQISEIIHSADNAGTLAAAAAGLTKTQKGLLDFYNRVVPSKANKILKKWGVGLRNSELPAQKGLGAANWSGVDYAAPHTYGDDASVKPIERPRVKGFFAPITPEMKSSIMGEGFDKGIVKTELASALGGALAGGVVGAVAGRDDRNQPGLGGAILGAAAGGFFGTAAGRFALKRSQRRKYQLSLHASPEVTTALTHIPPSYRKGFRHLTTRLEGEVTNLFVPYGKLLEDSKAAGIDPSQAMTRLDQRASRLYELPGEVVQNLKSITDSLTDNNDYKQFFEILRLRRDIGERVMDEGRRAEVFRDLSEARKAKTSGDTVRARQLLNRVKANRRYLAALPPMRANMTKADAIQSLINLETDARVNRPQIAPAVNAYRNHMKQVGQEAVTNGMIDPQVFADNISGEYFPDYLITFLEGQPQSVGGTKGLRQGKHRAGFALDRGPERDPSTILWNDFFGPIGKRLLDQAVSLENVAAAQDIVRHYGIPMPAPTLVNGVMTSKIPPGYAKWSTGHGDAGTLVEGIIPIPIHAELTSRYAPKSDIRKFVETVNTYLKGGLIRLSGGGFILQNFLGDTSNLYASLPLDEWHKMPRQQLRGLAASILHEAYNDPSKLSPGHQALYSEAEAGKTAGIGTAAAAAEVTGQTMADPRLRHLSEEHIDDPFKRAVRSAATTAVSASSTFDTIRAIGENTGRLAGFMHMIADGVPQPQAARVVKDVIGNYDPTNFTLFEQSLRQGSVLFYAFLKNNLNNWIPGLAREIAYKDGGQVKTAKGRVQAATVISKKWLRLGGTATVGALLWNHLFFPEAEAELNDYQKDQFHLLLPNMTDLWDEKNNQWNLIYVGFPTPANLAARSVGLGGMPNRLAHQLRGTGAQDWPEQLDKSFEQAINFWASLLHPGFNAVYGWTTGKDMITALSQGQGGRDLATPGAPAGQRTTERVLAPVHNLPMIRPAFAAAREGASADDASLEFIRRMTLGSVAQPINRRRLAAKAVVREIARGRRAADAKTGETNRKLVEGQSQELTPEVASAMAGQKRVEWLTSASKLLHLPELVRDLQGVPPDQPGAVGAITPTVKFNRQGPVVVPTKQQFQALGPDATLKLYLEMLGTSKSDSWRSGAVNVVTVLAAENAAWDLPKAIMQTLQQEPSMDVDIELAERLGSLEKASGERHQIGDRLGRKVFGTEGVRR